ncbi:MAG TPA: DUF1631 family protein, partial [Arenimonas sp.]|nr:DUF1631 family protein [Arenimonas sp.]
QSRWLEAQRLVKRTRPDFIPRYLIALEAELASIRSEVNGRNVGAAGMPSRHTLSLVAESEIDESFALTEISNRAEVQNSLPLYLLGQRFGVLAGKPAFDSESLPVGPQALCRMLRQASDCLELALEHRVLLYRTFERNLSPVYTGFVEAINSSLARNGVLPHLQYIPIRVRAPAPNQAAANARPRRSDAPTGPTDEAAKTDKPTASASLGLGGAAGAGQGADTRLPRDLATSSPASQGDQDAFQLMRQLLAGRRQLLGKLGNPRGTGGSGAMPVETGAVLETLGNLQHRVLDQPGKAPTRNVAQIKQDLLAQLRTQLPGESAPALAEEDSDAIDLVGMLFDHIMKDVRPNSPAAALLAKLQAPLLRVALQDKSFFTRQQHPARQMLNAIAETGAYWLGEEEADQPLVGKMQSLVERTLRDFNGDVGLFQTLVEDMGSHLQTIARKAEVAEKRQVEAARGKEKLALARKSAAKVVEDLLKKKNLPRFTHTLLSQAWTDVLALTALRHGEESEAWQQQLDVAQRLVEVAKAAPGQSPLEAAEADQLRGDIQSALAQVGYHEQEAQAIASRLIDPQGGGGDDDGASRTELTMRLKARARLGSDKEDPKVARTRLSAEAQAHLEQIKHLPFGTWFEFQLDQRGSKVRRRLSWFSTVTSHVLFVNHRGQKVGEHTLESLARAMAQGQARVVEEEKGTLIDRAWGAVVGALRSFAGQKPGGDKP